MINHLKKMSRERLCTAILHTVAHPVWTGGGGWKVKCDGRSLISKRTRSPPGCIRSTGLSSRRTMVGRCTLDTVRTRLMRFACEQSVDIRRAACGLAFAAKPQAAELESGCVAPGFRVSSNAHHT
jgi:hypothetical protein